MRPSTQNGIRQQPNQPPRNRIPPQSNHDIKPVVFSTRVTIVWWQWGQIHCIGRSPYISDGVVIIIWVPIGGAWDSGIVADVEYIPIGGPCGCKIVDVVEYIPTGGGIGGGGG